MHMQTHTHSHFSLLSLAWGNRRTASQLFFHMLLCMLLCSRSFHVRTGEGGWEDT